MMGEFSADLTASVECTPRTGPRCDGQRPLGLQALGRYRLFRYEVQCWPDGTIPDRSCAVGGTSAIGMVVTAACRRANSSVWVERDSRRRTIAAEAPLGIRSAGYNRRT